MHLGRSKKENDSMISIVSVISTIKSYSTKFLGPLVTIFLCVLIEILRSTKFGIPNPPALLVLTIVYSSFVGGLLSGAVSGVVGWFYIAYFFSISTHQPFQYTDENIRRVGVWAFTIPLIVIMVGVLKRRSILALYKQLKEKERAEKKIRRAEQNLRTLYQELEVRVKERTQDLLRTEIELRLVINALPVGIAYIDKDQRYKFCNDTYCKWNHLRREQIIGNQVKQVLDPQNYDKVNPYMIQTLTGQQVTVELQMNGSTKSEIISLTNVPDFDENGVVRGFVILMSDISAHKEIEFQLKRAKEAAESANAAKSAFLANMSHEIRTPLGVVVGFSEILTTEELSPSEKVSCIQAIKRNGDLLSGIINDILDLSKVEVGKLQVEKSEVTFDELFSDVATILNLHAQNKGLNLSLKTEADVPHIIKTDLIRFRQILLNIVGNAIKFTQKGSIEMTVRCLKKETRSLVAIDVKDTGLGITPDQASRLFHAFTQVDSTAKRQFGGAGLGLVFSKRLAQLLGGDVELTQSELGKGSTFTITIDPGSVSQQILHSIPKPQNPSPNPSSVRLDGVKVLLVDDSPDNQVLASRILSLAGATVGIAENGKEAVTRATADHYDVVLMDLQMPIMDGYEATAELRKLGYVKPIIALTAHALKEEQVHCLTSGFDDHLSKPVNRQILIERVAHFSGK